MLKLLTPLLILGLFLVPLLVHGSPLQPREHRAETPLYVRGEVTADAQMHPASDQSGEVIHALVSATNTVAGSRATLPEPDHQLSRRVNYAGNEPRAPNGKRPAEDAIGPAADDKRTKLTPTKITVMFQDEGSLLVYSLKYPKASSLTTDKLKGWLAGFARDPQSDDWKEEGQFAHHGNGINLENYDVGTPQTSRTTVGIRFFYRYGKRSYAHDPESATKVMKDFLGKASGGALDITIQQPLK